MEQKLLGRSRKSLAFHKSNFFGSEKFQVSAICFAEIKSLVVYTFSCTFAVIQILDNISSLPFISWAISMKHSGYYFFMPIYGCAKFRWQISKNKKYAISDRPHWRQLDLCETSFLLLNGSHWILKFSPTYKLDLRKTKLFHNQPSGVCSRYPNMCDIINWLSWFSLCSHRKSVGKNPSVLGNGEMGKWITLNIIESTQSLDGSED
jgi:hypothetical protein